MKRSEMINFKKWIEALAFEKKAQSLCTLHRGSGAIECFPKELTANQKVACSKNLLVCITGFDYWREKMPPTSFPSSPQVPRPVK